jgi:hypothetical protein
MEEFFQLLDQLKESKNVKRVMAHYRSWIKSLPAQMISAFAGVLPQVRCRFSAREMACSA